jgi:nucleoside 2-deoxyribosyltransferase
LFKVVQRLTRAFHIHRNLRFYLAGPISHEANKTYIEWREDIEQFLKSIGHEGVNPLKKYPVPAEERRKVETMMKAQKDEISREYIRRRIVNPDIAMVDSSDAVIAYISKYSTGTSAECGLAYYWNKPVYVVTNLPREQWSTWFVGLSTLIFLSFEELKTFLRNMEVGV